MRKLETFLHFAGEFEGVDHFISHGFDVVLMMAVIVAGVGTEFVQVMDR